NASAAFAQIVAIKAVGKIAERDSGCRIRPSDLAAEAGMTKRLSRIGPSKATQIGLAVAAGDHDSKRPIRRHTAGWIDHVAAANTPRLAQHLGLPDTRAVMRPPVIKQRLVKQCDLSGRGHQTASR